MSLSYRNKYTAEYQSHEKTAKGLISEIENKIHLKNLSIDDIRGQDYDSAANMAEK